MSLFILYLEINTVWKVHISILLKAGDLPLLLLYLKGVVTFEPFFYNAFSVRSSLSWLKHTHLWKPKPEHCSWRTSKCLDELHTRYTIIYHPAHISPSLVSSGVRILWVRTRNCAALWWRSEVSPDLDIERHGNLWHIKQIKMRNNPAQVRFINALAIYIYREIKGISHHWTGFSLS